jgi:pimeloyl-ACP methyl ester carboxylesterase
MADHELEIVRRFNAARTPQELADLLRNPSPEEAKALAAFLGEEKFARLRALSFTVGEDRGDSSSLMGRNVVVLPGIMGSELEIRSALGSYNLWLSLLRISREGLDKLKLDSTGAPSPTSAHKVVATGLLLKYYGELIMTLGQSWNVRAFAYDWRLDLDTQAAVLLQFIRTQFGGQPVSIVAHSMGGLVARALWRLKPKANAGAPLLTRLVMLGTPNHGSFEVPLILTGIEDTVKKLTWLTHPFLSVFNREEGRRRLLAILSTFPGIYQMLPLRGTGAQQLAKSATYSAINPNVGQSSLDRGVGFLKSLDSAIDAERMTYVAGYGIETIVGVDTGLPLDRLSSYWASDAGDGRVSHELGLLPGVPTYYVPAAHGELPVHQDVLAALQDLLQSGSTNKLEKEVPQDRALSQPRRPNPAARDDALFASEVRDWAEQARAFNDQQALNWDPATTQLEDEILSNWLGDPNAPSSSAPDASVSRDGDETRFIRTKPKLVIRLVGGNIADCHRPSLTGIPGIDAVAVGIYQSQRKAWAAIGDIDNSIASESQREGGGKLLTDLIERGTVRGDLAVSTLIPDPRDDSLCRDIVLVGMGIGGQFGPTEARQTARELAWYLGRVGKKHLATILIGAGRGNLSPGIAMRETLIGLARGVNDSRIEHNSKRRLEVVTFVEFFEDRIRDMHEAIMTFGKAIGDRHGVDIEYKQLTEEELKTFDEKGVERTCQKERERIQRRAAGEPSAAVHADLQPTKIIVEQVQDSFWFSAITDSASIPQRQVEVDPKLIDEQNDILVAAMPNEVQIKAGRVLGLLLIPRDFRRLFASGAPVVLDVDTNTARVHWELVVHENPDVLSIEDDSDPQFLSLRRGFTRQLRTRVAPPPEPLPAAGRIMRALIVADPAADAPLLGAQREGFEVAQIFQAFNQRATGGSRIDVTQLIGAGAATRQRVLSELLVGHYDILHYAGHCYFDNAAPLTCGWLFHRGSSKDDRVVLAARELRAVDRVPRFIFSNACESGVMPIRPEERSSAFAPAFAETFFERGVNNFVCTGWPVNDRAARLFARVFYGHVLGLVLDEEATGVEVLDVQTPASMSEAMRAAREAVRLFGSGLRTWGAYQHYGNPYTRFFPPGTTSSTARGQSGAPPRRDGSSGGSAEKKDGDPGASSATAAKPSRVEKDHAFFAVQQAIDAHGNALRAHSEVIDVRPGYRFIDDWITNEPAIIVVVKDPARLSATAAVLPSELDGVPVDIVIADPFEQLAAGEEQRSLTTTIKPREFLAPGEAPIIDDEQLRSLTAYVPPKNAPLDPVDDDMKLTCHVSPDQGWPTLSNFLQGVKTSLSIAMYDFTAPHVLEQVRAAVKPKGKSLVLVLDPQVALSDGGSADNPKANDVREEEVIDVLRQAAQRRFDFTWAAVTHKDKVENGIFPKAYHIKVAVRDQAAFWLSSGNWQSSNQPPLDVVPREQRAEIDFLSILKKYNREWHVVVEHPGLAQLFDKFIQHDAAQAKPLQLQQRGGLEAETWPELLVPIEPEEDRAIVNVERQPTLPLHGRIKVQPVLTPDNYPEVVKRLIDEATSSIRFQNQYVNIGKTIPPGFDALLKALKAKCEDPAIKVQIILRNIGDVRKMLEALQAYGFDVTNRDMFRLQKSTHTKGIIVDDQKALIGSHNWSGPGTTRNRDASLLFDNKAVAAYYAKVFDHDWTNLAKPRAMSNRDMPRVALATRDAITPPGYVRVPWHAYFEDVDDL